MTEEEKKAEDFTKASVIAHDIKSGVKRTPEDLSWYIRHLSEGFHAIWRHKESDTVYDWVGFGLAATGSGVLELMVHYVPYGLSGPRFERQYFPFLDKFEAVRPRTVWDPA